MIRCFDIGGSKIVVANVSAAGEIVELARLPTPIDNFNTFSQALAMHCDNTQLVSISIAGVVHPASGKLKSANIPCISGLQLAAELAEVLDVDVHVINDANAFALAESQFGKAKNHDVVLAIILGTGVGGGIVLNGEVMLGVDGTAGEWGHGPASTVRTGATLPQIECNCGQTRCLDTLGGARGIECLYQHMGFGALPSQSIVDAWVNGDADAQQVIDVWLDVVGGALANVVNLLAPSIVAVGGGLASCSQLVKALDREVCNRRLAVQQPGLLYAAANGPEQGLLGAAIFAQQHSA